MESLQYCQIATHVKRRWKYISLNAPDSAGCLIRSRIAPLSICPANPERDKMPTKHEFVLEDEAQCFAKHVESDILEHEKPIPNE